jgi:site-specific DNA-methyltransferase (adenine-specific)
MELMARYPDKYFDWCIIDPPYGINITSQIMGGRQTIKPDSSKNWDNKPPTKQCFDEVFRVSKNQIIWGGNYFPLPQSRYFAIWDKGDTMYGRDFAECEYAWVSLGGTRIYKYNPNQLDRFHPTQKPVALYKWLLSKYAKPNDKILDCFLGSASIAIACHDLNFNLTGCELDKHYFDLAIKRVTDHTNQLKLF